MTKRTYSMVAALLLACGAASAQNFNPTVEVTNTYQRNPSDVKKPLLEMAVPDSLMRFDLDFDYSVFEKRYEGSYSFKPYMLNMTPDKNAFRGHKLYVKAGAGYSLHPSFDLVFTPLPKGGLDLNLYASHHSFFGNYSRIQPEEQDGIFKLNPSKDVWKGYDALTTAGFEGRYNWENTMLSFGAGYYGLMSKDSVSRRSYNAIDFNARIRSNRTDEKYIFYDFGLSGRFGEDAITASADGSRQNLTEGIVALHGSAGPMFDYFHRALLDVDVVSATYGSLFHNSAAIISFVPKYEIETGKWNFSLGLKLEATIRGSQKDSVSFGLMHAKKGKVLYPAVHVSFAPSDNVQLFASATGGSDLNTYSSLISDNHHLTPSFRPQASGIMDNSVESLNAKAGVRGNLLKKLQFEVNGGAAFMENGLLECGMYRNGSLLPGVTYQDYNLAYANVLLGLEAGKVSFDAGLHYKHMNHPDKDSQIVGFELPSFSADARFIFNFNSRVYAGITCEGVSSRNGLVPVMVGVMLPNDLRQTKIPGYADLGLVGGYQLNRRFGFWIQAGNLLCETVQRNMLYAEKGPWGTAGITITL